MHKIIAEHVKFVAGGNVVNMDTDCRWLVDKAVNMLYNEDYKMFMFYSELLHNTIKENNMSKSIVVKDYVRMASNYVVTFCPRKYCGMIHTVIRLIETI